MPVMKAKREIILALVLVALAITAIQFPEAKACIRGALDAFAGWGPSQQRAYDRELAMNRDHLTATVAAQREAAARIEAARRRDAVQAARAAMEQEQTREAEQTLLDVSAEVDRSKGLPASSDAAIAALVAECRRWTQARPDFADFISTEPLTLAHEIQLSWETASVMSTRGFPEMRPMTTTCEYANSRLTHERVESLLKGN